jgi:uncharacterized membrane protein YgcG
MKFQRLINTKFKTAIQFLGVLTLLVLPSTLNAEDVQYGLNTAPLSEQGERILNFYSDIKINADGTVEVIESIKVIALGQEIKRGIYRDFPTKYQDRYGNSHNVSFDIVSVTRDGASEDYHTENMDNGVRVYFGNADVYLNFGVYTYQFIYKTDRQVGYFADHDEFYWNVTGNGWIFPIDNASAKVTLPGSVESELLKASGYTGVQGSKAADLSMQTEMSSATFMTTKSLNASEGLTIVFEFPKGIIHEPTRWENFKYFLRDNYAVFIDVLLLILVFMYFYNIWNKVGRDPKSKSIIAQYEQPRGLSPGALSYIDNMGFDNKALVAMIINMAVKGYLKIDEEKKVYKLTLLNKEKTSLNVEEKILSENFFDDSDMFEIKQKTYKKMMKCERELSIGLNKEHGNIYFESNGKYIAKGAGVASVAILIIIILRSFQSGMATLIAVLCLVAITSIFFRIIPRRTVLGRQVQDEIEGFKMFLSVTEKDRMNFHNPPERTPELFEKFLPFALALGVENKWAEQFEDVFKKLGPDGYNPGWYHGNALAAGSLSGFTDKMSSGMSSTISSSSTPPGSSSGSGGGGSSGGGGGGGGGGGW